MEKFEFGPKCFLFRNILVSHYFFSKTYSETNQKTPDWWNANFRGFYFRTKFGGFNPYEPMLNMITSHRMSTNSRIQTIESKLKVIWSAMDSISYQMYAYKAWSCPIIFAVIYRVIHAFSYSVIGICTIMWRLQQLDSFNSGLSDRYIYSATHAIMLSILF